MRKPRYRLALCVSCARNPRLVLAHTFHDHVAMSSATERSGKDKRDFGDVDPAPRAASRYDEGGLVSVQEYRQLTLDNESTDAEVSERLRFLESLCLDTIRAEFEKLFPPSV